VSDYYHDDPVEPLSPKRKKTSVLAALVLFAVGGFYLQSTLAANFTLNSKTALEFGQGITQTVSCAGTPEVLTVTPYSTFINVAGAGAHYLNSYRIDGIPTACQGADISFATYPDSSSTPQTIFDSTSLAATIAIIYVSPANTFLPVNSGNITVTKNSNSSFTASFNSPAATAADVAKITLQSSAHSSAGITWTSRTSAADNQWFSVTYGKGIFVAVSSGGGAQGVMTSPDGITWTSHASAAANAWWGLAYGNGMFVAVAYSGTGNRVMTSPDGITWTSRNAAAENSWLAVTYGDGLFVAVAETGVGNRVMTSPNGINWTIRASAADNQWGAITYGNGMFVAASSSGTGNRIMTSPDGITWTSHSSAVDGSWYGLAYGNGLFVAMALVDTVGTLVVTSPDGINWTARATPLDHGWIRVGYGNGLFVALGFNATDGARISTSPDGITWTTRSSVTGDGTWRAITYGNGRFVATTNSGSGNQVMTSN